jgi:Domain of unknown function DUF29
MPDDLYERDILAWSERQVDLLRRVANGERINDVDWPNVIEEIADVGGSALASVQSFLRQAMIHLIKIHQSGDDLTRSHWRVELDNFLVDAAGRFAPSMRQRIDVQAIWSRARRTMMRSFPADARIRALPENSPWSLDELLADDHEALIAALSPDVS